jgi:hypothetical protein
MSVIACAAGHLAGLLLLSFWVLSNAAFSEPMLRMLVLLIAIVIAKCYVEKRDELVGKSLYTFAFEKVIFPVFLALMLWGAQVSRAEPWAIVALFLFAGDHFGCVKKSAGLLRMQFPIHEKSSFWFVDVVVLIGLAAIVARGMRGG